MTRSIQGVAALFLLIAPCWGQTSAPNQHWYWWLRDQVQFVEAAAVAADPAPAGDLVDEVRDLRAEVEALKSTVELHLGSLLANMQEENARLRAEVQRLQALNGASDDGRMFVPNPYNRPPRNAAELPGASPDPSALMPAQEAAPTGTSLNFEVIDTWGRTQEDLAGQEEAAPTLKGMIVLATGDPGKEALEAMGRQLYAENADFDNINIEIYNDRVSANAAATGAQPDAKHRVLIISKHAASNRKIMIYLGGSTPVTTPLE